ncbi:MAG: CHASE2 domain-containing protein [Bdellovibrionota bacterium]
MFSASDIGTRVEPMLMDYWFKVRGVQAVPSQIVIVAIDEHSYQSLNVSTLEILPRKLQAELLRKLADYKVRGVMFDLVFRSASPDPAGDHQFAEALKLVPTYLGRYVKIDQRVGLSGKNEVREEPSDPLALFRENARGTVLLNLRLDDRIVRRFLIGLSDDPTVTPMAHVVVEHPEQSALPNAEDFIDFYGPAGTIPTVSMSDLLNDDARTMAPLLEGRYVFIGTQMMTQTGLIDKDTFLTPYSGAPFFGVEIHATAAGNILEHRWIRRLSPAVEMLILNLTALLLSFGLTWLRPRAALGVFCSAVLAWSCLSYSMFRYGVFLPGLWLVAVTLPLAFVVSTLYYYFVLQRSYREIESALGVELKVRE